MKRKKILFLVLALLLPVALFVFLKLFGRNEFQVPYLHTEGGIEAPAHCGISYKYPYVVADSVTTIIGLGKSDSVYVFYFDPALESTMRRVSTEFADDAMQVIPPAKVSKKMDPAYLRECILLMKKDTSVALIDHRNRIRGYYDGRDRDEMDRLMVEIKIILKKY